MIRTASFQNFKLLRDVSLELGRLNVIVGRNGVGKSSVLEGLHLLSQLARPQAGEEALPLHRLGAVLTGPWALRRLLSKPDRQDLGLSVQLQEGPSFRLTGEALGEAGDQYKMRFGTAAAPYTLDLPQEKTGARHFFSGPTRTGLGSALHLRLQADALAADHYSDRAIPSLERSGEGLASALQYLQGLRDGILEAIEADLARVVPGASRIRALPSRLSRVDRVRVSVDGQENWHEQRRELTGARFEVEFKDLGWIRAEDLSEGTLLALGLITLLRHHPPRLLLLDDIDKGLHPVAQRELVGLLRGVLDLQPDLQIVATSHSPFVLDALDATETFVAGALGPTESRILRLDAHPAWPKRQDYMQPGEFWSAVGEGWVAEQRSEPKA